MKKLFHVTTYLKNLHKLNLTVSVIAETQRPSMETTRKLSLSLSIVLKLSESCEILQKGDTLCSTGLNATLTVLCYSQQWCELENHLHECFMFGSVAVGLITTQKVQRLSEGPQAPPAVNEVERSTHPTMLHLPFQADQKWFVKCVYGVNYWTPNNPNWPCWR